MAQVTRKKTGAPLAGHLVRGLREGILFIFSAAAIYSFIALASYQPDDPGWSHQGFTEDVANVGGVAGAWFADVFLFLFGYFAYLFPVMVAYAGWRVYMDRDEAGFDGRQFALRTVGFMLTLTAGSALARLHFSDAPSELPLGTGGVLGDLAASALVAPFSFVGATLFLLALFLAGVTLFTGLSWLRLIDTTGRLTFRVLEIVMYGWSRLREVIEARRAFARRTEVVQEVRKTLQTTIPRIEPMIKRVERSERAQVDCQGELFEHPNKASLPSLGLLDKPSKKGNGLSKEELAAMSRLVELKLLDFNIEVEVVAVHPGPVITRFELQPAPGVKVSQVTNLAKDLARALAVISVRVVEVIPGRPYIGLEIPNEYRETVCLGEILESKVFSQGGLPLSLALGKDIGGHPMAVDLAKMPHLLVAGTTGSGKSVALNCMVLSLLYNASPERVRLIMIDPKMLELSVYEGIPHLLAPVVTDMKEAANALRWSVAEMDRRYRLMAAMGTRNIAGYNRKVAEAIEAGEPILDPTVNPNEVDAVPELEALPYIVVIVDELADMMMIVGKKVEELIARLAQKARAAGIHLILATQRPSVDVLTGLIKANIPTRIAFQVSSRVDSRTVLDQMGAEQLLGHGDMLYLPPGTAVPIRVHGAFVDDHEVHKVVNEIKSMGEPDYIEEILESDLSAQGFPGEENGEGAEVDELYDMAVRIVTETRRASISGIQRRLKIGYNRAARMVEDMERAGVVGPLQSNGSREVLAPPPPGD